MMLEYSSAYDDYLSALERYHLEYFRQPNGFKDIFERYVEDLEKHMMKETVLWKRITGKTKFAPLLLKC